ncbi:pupal cuticle protein Edg-84A-like [Chironomus tepperi]|uniref:pupal cuticle protein Edg-84A-like n=1 Tax=Chironomus tepperi TaxID=113505 RepID=UPI00391F5D89
MLKIIIFVAIIALTSTSFIPVSYHTISHHPIEWMEPVEWKEAEKPGNYDFKYDVHDEKTGDIKRQSETAIHGVVKGQYSLIDSDGYKRIVDYTADDHHGFQATVKREPTHYKIPESVKIVKVIPHEHWW